jgi:alpha-N-arabinofuranosidase
LAPVAWDADGWPVMGDHGRIALEMQAPGWEEQPSEPESDRDEFDAPDLHPRWNFLRNPRPQDWSLTERPGSLCLTGSPVTLDDVDSPAWVGRRQQHFDCDAWAALDFAPQHEGEEAGLSVRMNETHHYEIAVIRQGNELRIIVRRRIGSLRVVTAQAALHSTQVQLGVHANKDTYTFGYKEKDGSEPHWLASGETRYLSTEVAGGFTGVYFSMYATGNGRPCTAPAYFDWFEYKAL